MVHTVEALRRLKARKVWRKPRMRPKIERDGEVGPREYSALNRTDGFDEVLAYGLPELAAEAIVLRHTGVLRGGQGRRLHTAGELRAARGARSDVA